MTAVPAPVADWVTIPDLTRDPFAVYERLRAEGGVHWVPAVGRYLVTSYDAVHETELDQEIFSANEEGSLMIRAMGHSMLRRDDPEHYIERRAWQPALQPGIVKRVWTEMFERNAARYLDELAEKGSGADLVRDFAAPYAAENLRQLLGFHNVEQHDLQRWSQTMIDATGNYADAPDVWAKGEKSFDEVDDALDEMLAWHAAHLDDNPTLIAHLLSLPGEVMPIDRIRANMKMTIGGGLNEPRDAIGVAAWALLTHPEQRAAVEADPSLWPTVFEETIRWVAPIGMYSRQVTRDTVLTGVQLPAGARLGICILSANRDEKIWEAPERFDIRREVKPHLAFGKGTHVCLGAWVARAEVATVALPALFSRFEGLALDPEHPAEAAGWVFRGMTKLPARWEGVRSAAGASAAGDTASAPRIAIVGSGPAGSFTAQAVRRRVPASRIDVFEQLPVPFGLVRYGVAADHQGTKAVARQFEKLFTDDAVRFFGNVRVGTGDGAGDGADVSLDELRENYDAVVLATGLHADAPFAVPGADLPGVHGAGRITRLLNGHPDETEVPSLGESVAIVGHGNVALDVARLIARTDLEGTDLDDAVHAELASRVRVIHLVGRSRPEAAKFDPVMVRELAGLPGVEHVVHGVDINALPVGTDARADAVRLLVERGADTSATADEQLRIEWWFEASPRALEGEDRAAALRLATPDGETVLAVDDVITAIGFGAGEAGPIHPALDAPDTAAEIAATGRIEPALYAAGWLRRGPRGTIPDQREDARKLAHVIAEDLAAAPERSSADFPRPAGSTDYLGWRRIDHHERTAAAPGRVRAKLAALAALVDTAGEPGAPLPAALIAEITAQREAAAAPIAAPITIAYATESGGAQFAAEELHAALAASGDGTAVGDGAASGDVELLDLAEVMPGDLDRSRFHVLLCSTYGDGELPNGIRDFVAALTGEHAERTDQTDQSIAVDRAAPPELSGLEYAVFGLGDRSYAKTYSRGSELLDEALAACGARRVGEYGRHDAGGGSDAAAAAAEWFEGVREEIRALRAAV